MKSRFYLTVIIVAVTIFVTVRLYTPGALLLYKIREPYFAEPITSDTGTILVRNDAYGNGEYGSKRRNGRTHGGIDILAPVGAPVYAAKSGIAFRGKVPTGYGKYIMIYHPDGYQTYYGHLSEWEALSTAHVRQGELIGYVGKTGNASPKAMRPHLHFEIRKEGKPQDPRVLMR